MRTLLVGFALLATPVFANSESKAPPIPNFALLLKEADSVTVYEGLPHPMLESQARIAEKINKETFGVASELFYKKPLAIAKEDQASLEVLFRSEPLCTSYAGPKLCGGFHADYAIEWKKGDDRVAIAMLCFSCHEIWTVQGEKNWIADMTKTGFEALQPLLGKYRQQRPPFTRNVDLSKPETIAPIRPPSIEIKFDPIAVPAPKPEIKR